MNNRGKRRLYYFIFFVRGERGRGGITGKWYLIFSKDIVREIRYMGLVKNEFGMFNKVWYY